MKALYYLPTFKAYGIYEGTELPTDKNELVDVKLVYEDLSPRMSSVNPKKQGTVSKKLSYLQFKRIIE